MAKLGFSLFQVTNITYFESFYILGQSTNYILKLINMDKIMYLVQPTHIRRSLIIKCLNFFAFFGTLVLSRGNTHTHTRERERRAYFKRDIYIRDSGIQL